MIISIICVLNDGCAYLPIYLTNKEKRITYILDDAKAKLLVTNMCRYSHISLINNNRLMNIENNALPLKNEHSYYINKCEQLLDENMPIIVIDDYDLQSQLKDYAIENPQLKITGNSLVYVMYTSGTTGKPKGVMLEQLGVTARIMAMIKKTGINPSSKYLFKTNYVFDVSFSDIFMTLLSGASLYITKSVFNIDEIYNLIVENDIDICHFVPSQLDVLQDYPFKEYIFNQLQIINVSGEKFSKSLMFKNTNIKYINYYGPTEAGEVSYDITDLQNHISEHLKLETIGYPLDHAKLYILDSSLKPLPIGAIGEIYIGGAALARGYLNQPILTSKRFIANPFQTEEEKRYNSNSRIYKTGDLARYLPNGNIEYIGRVDNQVKIRGYRVELEEIESRLSHYPTIKHTIALIQSDFISVDKNEQYIVAYYVSESKLDEHLIYNYLAQELPDYMLPDLFVHLEYLPLTTNGKLDKSKLPKIHINDNIENYVKPRNEVEQKICEIYADILKLDADKISANANFFKLGGNSISAIRLTFKLQNYFIVDVNDIFEYKTPANLAKFLLPNHTHLTDRLEQIKLMYSKLKLNKEAKYTSIKQKHAIYKRKMESFTFDKKTRPISTILLTGGTGYLGCHLLYQILSTTNHTIYLPIRADSKEHSYKRLYNKFKYYFDKDLNIYSDRINVFQANLNKVNLGLDKSEYEKLASNINSIIHCAALVKHYGSNSEFYLENVQATINLLELAKLSANKDFHYISTIGVFADKSISGYSYNIFTEDSIEMKYANLDNIYTKTKYQGEQVTLKYREFGIKTNIYRIGNLAINSVTKKTQENVEDNAFLHRIKTILNLGMVPQELDTVEISPVDCTATAIILLFNQESLYNQIYHVFNPKKYSLFKLLNNKSNNIRQVSLATFIDTIVAQTNTLNIYKIELFILHQWGLKSNISNVSETVIFQDKTNYILDQLQFKWANITRRALSKYS
ncbi:MAG: AMP-binding protein [Neisseriaceae bacterium]